MSKRDEMAKAYTYPNWPKKTDHERPERYDTFMQYEVGYIVEEAFQAGWAACAADAEAREAQLVNLVRELIEALEHYAEVVPIDRARAKLTELNIYNTEEEK